ncbi:EamA family transporter [Aminobacter sp. MSH1]|nr:EamA family transporter [Aminobacter sp. MSH1]
MKPILLSWQFWALASAAFAALTAIFAKIGVENVGSDFATFIRTIVILAVLAAILAVTRQFQALSSISGRSYTFLILSGMATGGSWICYFRALKLGDAARVAPIDKLSVVLVAIFGVIFLGEHLSLPNWAGVALIAAGAVLVAYKGVVCGRGRNPTLSRGHAFRSS